ncbi:MAG: hypothetical protein R3F46_06285 [bacterium]
MAIQVARQDPAERFNFGFLLNPVSIAALLIVVLLAVVTQLLEKRGSAHPDPMAVFEQRAYFNLVERGLLRRTLEAGDTHELLLPRNESVLTRELICSKRSLDDEEARIRFLLANYPVICERHGYDWTVDRRRSGKYKWRDDTLLASENLDNPYNRRLCGIIDELLSSGRY